jgi:hypothetical protein
MKGSFGPALLQSLTSGKRGRSRGLRGVEVEPAWLLSRTAELERLAVGLFARGLRTKDIEATIWPESLAALGFRDGGHDRLCRVSHELKRRGLLDPRLVVTDGAPILLQAVGARAFDPRMRNLPEQGPPREPSDDLRPNHKGSSVL